MSFHTHVNKIDINKLLYIVVTIAIVGYIIIYALKTFDFKSYFNSVKNISSTYYIQIVKNYVSDHKDYYYPIEGATYCITKQELQNSKELTTEELSYINDSIIEVDYNQGYNISYNNSCTEK